MIVGREQLCCSSIEVVSIILKQSAIIEVIIAHWYHLGGGAGGMNYENIGNVACCSFSAESAVSSRNSRVVKYCVSPNANQKIAPLFSP